MAPFVFFPKISTPKVAKKRVKMKKKRLNFPSPWRAIFFKIDACLTFFVEKKKSSHTLLCQKSTGRVRYSSMEDTFLKRYPFLIKKNGK